MSRPKNVYRGKRKYRWIITLILFIAAFIIIGGVWLFNYMQKFIVYDGDGLKLVLPFMEQEQTDEAPAGEEQTIIAPSVSAEVVISEPDFSQLSFTAGEDLEAIKARYVPASSMSSQGLLYYGAELRQSGRSAMVLQLQTDDGMLSYLSGVALTNSYGVNGQQNIIDAVASLKEQGVYLVAEIGGLLDTCMATRNAPLGLKTSAGTVLSNSRGSWLDPYNKDARAYVSDLIEEAALMGFDEVLLSGIACPKANDVVYSQPMSGSPSLTGGVATFALRMSEKARELGLRCSAVCFAEELRSGTGSDIGQDPELFFRFFDRVYVRTDWDHLVADVSALSAHAGGSAGTRVVPILSGDAPSYDSWATLN